MGNPDERCVCGLSRRQHGIDGRGTGGCRSFRLASHAPVETVGREYRNPRNIPLERCERPIGYALADSAQVGPDEHLVSMRLGAREVDQGCGLPQTERRGDWMQTYTGRQYWPLDPRPDDVDERDIAHHLSMLCRYCGACLRFYSVLEHSLGVAHVAYRHARRTRMRPYRARCVRHRAAFHDSPEAYCHDLIRPIKRCVSGYAEVERANDKAIADALGLPDIGAASWHLIKAADNAMLLAEQALIMAPAPAKWAPIDVPDEMLADALAWLRASRWKRWRRWRWWQKWAFLRLHRELDAA